MYFILKFYNSKIIPYSFEKAKDLRHYKSRTFAFKRLLQNKPSPHHSFNATFRKLTFCYIVNPRVHDLDRKAWKPTCYLRTLRGKRIGDSKVV